MKIGSRLFLLVAAITLISSRSACGQLLTRATDLCVSYVSTFTHAGDVFAIASNGRIAALSKDAVHEVGHLTGSDGNVIADIYSCKLIGTDTIACITNTGTVHVFNLQYQHLSEFRRGENEGVRDVVHLWYDKWLVLTSTGACFQYSTLAESWTEEPICLKATVLAKSASMCIVGTSAHYLLRVRMSTSTGALSIDTIHFEAPGIVTAIEVEKSETYIYVALQEASKSTLYVLSLKSGEISVLAQPTEESVLLHIQNDSLIACIGKNVLTFVQDELRSRMNADTTRVIELFSPTSICLSNGRVFLVGDHSLLMNVKQNESWQVLSYLPRRPLSSYTHLSDIGQLLITRHSYHSLPIRMGKNELEWNPLDTRGNCEFQGFVVGQRVSPLGSLVTVFSGIPSWTTSIASREYESVCTKSDYAPDSWSYVSADTAIGYSVLSQKLFWSVDGGRIWRLFGLLAAEGVSVLGTVGDTVVLMYANNAGLDTNVYKTSHSLTYAKFVDGIVVRDSIVSDIASLRSFRRYGRDYYAVLRSNVKTEGNLYSFCRVSLSPWKCEELLRVDTLVIGDFDFMDSTVVFTSVGGKVATFDLRYRQQLTTMRIFENETSFATSIRFIRDSVAIVSVGGEVLSGLRRVEFFQGPTSVDVEDPYASLQIAAIRAIEPNPTTDLSMATIVVANGWDLNDVQITLTSTFGAIMDTFRLPTRLISSSATGEHKIHLSTKGLSAGVYVLNVRSSRNSHSKTLVVLQ